MAADAASVNRHHRRTPTLKRTGKTAALIFFNQLHVYCTDTLSIAERKNGRKCVKIRVFTFMIQ